MFLYWYLLTLCLVSYADPMRILSPEYASNLPGSTKHMKGGTERFARDFSTFLLEEGHSWIGVVQGPPEQVAAWEACGEEKGKKFFRIGSRAIASAAFESLTSIEEVAQAFEPEIHNFREILREVKPDVVFLNGFIPYSWFLLRAASEEGIPTAFQHAGILAKEMGCYPDLYSEGSLRMMNLLERNATETATANIFLNEHSKTACMELVRPSSMQGVSILPLPHAGWSYRESTPRVRETRSLGVVARWDRIKNHPAVLALAKEIQAQALPWTITAVTTIPATTKNLEFKEEYKSLIKVLAPMDHDDLRVFYRDQDVCLLPSLFETAGGVVAEALAEGTPTLISEGVGWVDEYQATGMDSWIADFSNPKQVVASLKEQFSRTTWPETAKLASDIQEHHDPQKVFTGYLSVFTKLIT
jgi:glycosyltransferase involved in cell wall biosynthesis